MSDIIAARPATAGPIPARRPKPGPKGKVLEPFAREVLLMAREGQSMQYIVNWLANPPREVAITRQAVHLWVKARIRKLVKLNAAFLNTGVGGPFSGSGALRAAQPSEKASGLDPPGHLSFRSGPGSKSSWESKPTPTDVSEFMVDASEFNRNQNPLVSDP